MKRLTTLRAIGLVACLAAALAGAISFHASAQSDFMRGDRMPYDAFERLPKTDIEIGGGVIHAAFAPGDIALPQEKVLDWVQGSAKAVDHLLRPLSGRLRQTAAGAGQRPARARRHHLGLARRGDPRGARPRFQHGAISSATG